MSLNEKVLDKLDGLAKKAVDDSKVDIKALDLINSQDVNGWVRSKYLRLYFDKKQFYRDHRNETEREEKPRRVYKWWPGC